MKTEAANKRFEERRILLKAATGLVGAVGLSSVLPSDADADPLGDEYAPKDIEGYALALSCLPGEDVDLCVSTTAKTYDIEVARVGAKRQVLFKKTDLRGKHFETPEDASTEGCRWPVSTTVPTGKDWSSGYYQVIMTTPQGHRGECYFVLRSPRPGKDASILMQLCTNTYNAYNTWGGSSLYSGPKGFKPRVSFERPYIGFLGPDNFTNLYSGWRRWELPFVQWAESAGYKLDFAINSDLELRPEILPPYRLVLSVGHDEYWSAGMRDGLERYIGNGGNVAFFSGNVAFWQVRTESHGQALVAWKQSWQQDPAFIAGDYSNITGTWSNRLIERPENTMTGVSFTYGGYHAFFDAPGDGAYTIHRPDHWIFEGTNLALGDSLGRGDKIVGYECDGCQFEMDNAMPVCTGKDGTPANFQILGTAPAALLGEIDYVSQGVYGVDSKQKIPQPGAAVLGSYVRGGTVVTTGSTEWVRGLERKNEQVVCITRNIFDRLSKA